jgi:AraC-like DNA-binding protein
MDADIRWSSVDPLGEALHCLRMSGTFYSRSEFTAPWGLLLPPMPGCLMFHFLTSGRCYLEVGRGEKRQLQQGDLVLVPHGQGHQLASARGVRGEKLFSLPRVVASERYDVIRHGGGGASTTMICGAVRFDNPIAARLIELLPRVIYIKASSSPHMEWINSMLRFMAAEASQLRPGGEAVITRLADILVIQTLRAWMAQDPAARTGWLGALQHPQIGRALSLIHADPARSWSLELLADESGMSRSAFAAVFAKFVGEPPMLYVARWRMHLALTRLKEEDLSLAEIAEQVGYQSEAAFSRAFKRVHGTAPGAVRRGARQSKRSQHSAPAPFAAFAQASV